MTLFITGNRRKTIKPNAYDYVAATEIRLHNEQQSIFASVMSKLDKLESKLDKLESKLDKLDSDLKNLDSDLKELKIVGSVAVAAIFAFAEPVKPFWKFMSKLPGLLK
jgi:hypothetical protein